MEAYKRQLAYAAVAGAAVWYGVNKYVEGCEVELVASQTKESAWQLVTDKCPSLGRRLVPTPYLCQGMLQTIYGTSVAFKRDEYSSIEYERESKIMEDGGTVSLDWYPAKPEGGETIVVVVPGLGGSSSEYHIRSLAKRLAVGSTRVVVSNHRGSGRTPLTSGRLYNAYDTSDLQAVVDDLNGRYAESVMVCVGFSLGGNLVTRYLGEQGDDTPIRGAVVISCPFDTLLAGRALSAPGLLNDRVFQPNLMATMRRLVKRNLEVIKNSPLNYDVDAIMKAERMTEIDNLVTARTYGHEDCWDYYKAASSVEYVAKIRRPFLAINAEDDPVTPIEGVPRSKFEENPLTALAVLRHGGHIGFFTGIRPTIWYLDPVGEFLGAVIQAED
ncbi:hypothetical protein GGF46_003066 [Coemansia sp. RSA 552]|nr:hypothetical protein GGF46_003066 [Coemansia sp. RSA 552]